MVGKWEKNVVRRIFYVYNVHSKVARVYSAADREHNKKQPKAPGPCDRLF